MSNKLIPAMQIHPTNRNDDGEQEVVVFKDMTDDEITAKENGVTPMKFLRREDGKTIFAWTGETPCWSGTPPDWLEETPEEVVRRNAQDDDRRRADAVRARLMGK